MRRAGWIAPWLAALPAVVIALAPTARGEEPAPAGAVAGPPPARLAPAPLELEPGPRGDAPRNSPRGRPDGAAWGWQLGAFLGSLAAAVAVLRGLNRHRSPALPADRVALLGALPLGGQHGLRVVRFGRRTLLVGVSPAGCHLLAETDEPLVQTPSATPGTVVGGAPPAPVAAADARGAA